MLIRKMLPRDVAEVAALEREIFSMPWSEKGFLDALSLGNTVYLVAEEDGKIAGYAGMYFSMEEGEITNVAVAPLMRRRGVGARLIEEIKKEAEGRLLARLVLEVRASNETAIRLYERGGFVRVGIRRGFYERPREDALIMIYGQ